MREREPPKKREAREGPLWHRQLRDTHLHTKYLLRKKNKSEKKKKKKNKKTADKAQTLNYYYYYYYYYIDLEK